MNTFFETIVRSSANPEKVSLTLKGILISYVGIVLLLAQVAGIAITETQVIEIIGEMSVAAGNFLMIVGALRKIYYLFK